MAGRSAMMGWLSRSAAILVALGTLAMMVATEPGMAIGWDEGYTLGREARVRAWFRAMRDPAAFAEAWKPPKANEELVEDKMTPPRAEEIDTRGKLLSTKALAWFWPFAREEPHGHPPFYAIVGLIGDVIAPSWEELPRARLGPILAFSLAAGAIFAAARRRWGVWPAAMAAGAWALQPQMFALGHYAGYDAILSALWVGAILVFANAVDAAGKRSAWGWAIVFGVLCGWAADTKLTGWFLPIPFVAWAAMARSRVGLRTILVGGAVALVTLYVFNPPWWGDPVGGVDRFLKSNLSRGKTIPIPVMFLGQTVFTPNQSLPWYNTLVWTAIATPVGFLAFAIVGAIRSAVGRRRADSLAILATGHWLFLLVLRALPHTPGHDGVRQFLPAFGGLALVAGAGAAWAVARFGRWGKGLVALAIAEGAVSVAVMMPVPLSYFSPVIGGLPGAAKIGMEPTYFWDALTPEALETLEKSTPSGRTVRFATFTTAWVHQMRAGKMRFGVYPLDPNPPAWYVVQNRPGQFRPLDRRLVREYGPRCVLVEKFGVPLVWRFPYDGVERILRTPGDAP